jgi:hypothetical protein
MPTLSIQLNAQAVYQANNLPFNADAVVLSNPDVNGNPQTVVYRKTNLSGPIIVTLALTYDTFQNVATVTKV